MKVICFLFDPNIGGPTIRVNTIYPRLGDDVQTRVAFPRLTGPAHGFLRDAGLNVDVLDIPKPVLPKKPAQFVRFIIETPRSVWRITRYLKTQKPDVVHVNGAFDAIPAIAAWLMRIPVVWHLNDMLFSPKLSKMLGRVIARIATITVVSAQAVGDHFGVTDKQPFLLPVPIDLDRFQAKQRQISQPVTLGVIANWNWIKGQHHAVATLRDLKSRGYDVRLKFFGKVLETQKDYWSPIINDLEQTGLNKDVDIEGFCSDIATALEQIDILLVPSASEAGPIVCVEALALGIPVVTFPVGDTAVMLDIQSPNPSGKIVAQNDPHAMADAVTAYIDAPESYENASHHGPKIVRTNFSAPYVVEQHLKLYRRAAKGWRTF